MSIYRFPLPTYLPEYVVVTFMRTAFTVNGLGKSAQYRANYSVSKKLLSAGIYLRSCQSRRLQISCSIPLLSLIGKPEC